MKGGRDSEEAETPLGSGNNIASFIHLATFALRHPFRLAFLSFHPSTMTSNVPIGNNNNSNITAPTPQNTPLTQAPISLGLSRPTVPDIAEDNEGDEEATTKSGLPANLIPGLNALVSGKLQDLVGKPSGYIDSLPTPVKLTIEGLKGVQSQHNELQEQFKRELYELEKKVRAYLR